MSNEITLIVRAILSKQYLLFIIIFIATTGPFSHTQYNEEKIWTVHKFCKQDTETWTRFFFKLAVLEHKTENKFTSKIQSLP